MGNSPEQMIGLVPVDIHQSDTEIIFKFDNGAIARFYHLQDCCEDVVVEDVNGDWNDLIGNPLLVVDERTSQTPEDGNEYHDSHTWTFYTFRGIGGSVDVRWHGESNGYYSESVDFWFHEGSAPDKKNVNE